jgi:hypothetical protein
MIAAVVMLVASIQFLREQAWARTALEVFTWLGLAWAVGFGIFWITSWVQVAGLFPGSHGAPMSSGAFTAFGVVGGVFVTFLDAGISVAVLWFLRGRPVREAMLSRRHSAEENGRPQ